MDEVANSYFLILANLQRLGGLMQVKCMEKINEIGRAHV